jgi:hypothetical protein
LFNPIVICCSARTAPSVAGTETDLGTLPHIWCGRLRQAFSNLRFGFNTLGAAANLVASWRRSMISKSKLGAIALVAVLPIAAMGLASPAFAIDPNSPALTGGGSLGHNRQAQTLRLKHHPAKQHVEHHQGNDQGNE